MSLTEHIDARLREITRPIMVELESTDENIAAREEELKELRAVRTRLVGIARQIDPGLVPKKEHPSKPRTLAPVSEERVREVLAWLRVNTDGGEFYGAGLIADKSFTLMSGSHLAKTLKLLHERELIRLVRTGTGGARFYKVIA